MFDIIYYTVDEKISNKSIINLGTRATEITTVV